MSTETTGAANQEGGDAGVDTQTTGTPDEQARDAQDENIAKLHGIHKDKAEKWNKVEGLMSAYGIDANSPTALQELNERLARSPAVQDESEPESSMDEDEIHAARQFAAKGDPVAKLTLKILEKNKKLEEQNERLVRGVEDAFTARDITDPKKRQRTLDHFQRNRHRLGDIKAAQAEIDAADLKADVERLTAQLARHQKGVTPNAPSTHVPDAAPGKINDKPKMNRSEFRAELDRLRSEDKHDEVMALQRKLRLNQIEVS